MSDKTFARVFDDLSQALRRTGYPALLGDGQEILKVSGRDGFVYARVQLPEGKTLIQVRCRKATPVYNAPVIVDRNPYDNVWEVVEEDPSISAEFMGGYGTLNVAAHGPMHGLQGGDPILVDPRQLTTFRVYPTSPASTSVQVAPYLYRYGGTWKYYAGTSAFDLASYIPDGIFNMQCVACLGIDASANTLTVVAGDDTYVPTATADAISFTGTDVVTALAGAAEDFISGKAIRLYGGQTAVNMYDVFFDCMQLAGAADHYLHNWTATTAPTASDDTTAGYSAKSLWAMTATEQLYVCMSATAGAAVWIELTGGGVSTDWWNVDLPDLDVATTDPSSLSDEFNDSSVDVKWATWNSAAWTEGAAYISKAATPATAVLGLTQALPAGDFTVFTKMRLSATGYVSGTTTALGGLALMEGTTAQKVSYFGFYKEPSLTYAACWYAHWTDSTTYSSSGSYGSMGVAVDTFIYLRLRRTGTTYYADWSTDGKDWHVNTLTLSFTPTKVGMAVSNTGTSASNTFEFDFWRYRNTYDSALSYGYGAPTLAAHALADHTDVSAAAQTANYVLAAGDGATAGDYRGRLLVAADIPALAYQPVDATLTSIAALGTAADMMIYTTALDTWAETALTAAGRALLDDADAAAQRTTLGLVAGGAGDIWLRLDQTTPQTITNGAPVFGSGLVSNGNIVLAGAQKIIGGTGTTSDLTLQTTSGVGVAGADMHFLVGDNGAVEAMTILNNGNVGIGTLTPPGKLAINTTIEILQGSAHISHGSGDWGLVIKRITNDTGHANLALLKSRGEAATPAVSGDPIGRIAFHVVNNAGTPVAVEAGRIEVYADTISGADVGTNMRFCTTTPGAAIAERMRIDNAGLVGIGTTTPTVRLQVQDTHANTIGVGNFRLDNISNSTGAQIDLWCVKATVAETAANLRRAVYIRALFTSQNNDGGYLEIGTPNVTVTGFDPILTLAGKNVGTFTSAAFTGRVGVGITPAAGLHVYAPTTTTNALLEVARLEAYVSTASTGSAAGFGPALTLYGESATDTTQRLMAQMDVSYVVSTDASRTVEAHLSATDYAATREVIAWGANGSAATLSFFGAAAVTKQTALTAQLTTITHTAPGTPDYAIQDLTQTTPFGFKTKDEGNTALSALANLQTRVAELETRGQAYGLLT